MTSKEREVMEPVASGVIRTLVSIDKNGVETWKEEPFYTAPPQRTWVGLTDEDVRQCSQDVVAGGKENCVDRFAYAIEAKLKAKNERLEKNA